MKFVWIALVLGCFTANGWASTDGPSNGGGGSQVESAFRLRGHELINMVGSTAKADSLCSAEEMRNTLNASKISVVEVLLKNGRPIQEEHLDAYTTPLYIQLLKAAWAKFFDSPSSIVGGRSIDALILHEIMRSTGHACPDDKFVLSDQVYALIAPRDSPSCGLTPSSIKSRIQDCSRLWGSSVMTKAYVVWNLVARSCRENTNKCTDVWQDADTGLLWGDMLDGYYTHYQAVSLDEQGNVIHETACASEAGNRANLGIGEKAFGLPTKDEADRAGADGLLEVLPNLGSWFWTASLFPTDPTRAWELNGFRGRVDENYPYGRTASLSVRCVGR